MNPAVRIDHVTKRYGAIAAVDGVSLNLAAGETLALLGPNGAGKSTLIKMILGLTDPSDGNIEVLGSPPGSHAARQSAAYLPENVIFHKSLTGHEQLTMFARLKGQPKASVQHLLERVALAEAMHARIGTYSKGMRQKLGLAQVLLGQPKIAILDEPTSGLDPLSREMFYRMISELAGAGCAVLLSSHALTELEARTDRIAILRRGKLVACDRLSALRAAAGLPVRLRVEIRNGQADDVASKLGGQRVNGQAVELVCEARDKVARLADVTRLGRTVADIDVVPPSLEDVYRYYSAAQNEGKTS